MTAVLALLSTSCIAISAILVAIGWRLIRKGNREAHRKVMMSAATMAVLFFIIYLTRTLFFGNVAFGGPDSMAPFYLTFLLFHIVLATGSAAMGITTITLALKGRFEKHRRIGPITAVVWFCTAITGVTTYILLFVAYPGDTTNLWDAIF